ncbi:MAG: FAD-dependent oxidoreductase [Planctomycetota bacterium]
MSMRGRLEQQQVEVDLCVVGGGMSGLCAAVAAARHGAKVALIQDRPVLGGNASSEVRMWICGAHGAFNRETGLLEEIHLNNIARNPGFNYSIWDSVLYETARFAPNLELFLNCAVCEGEMDGDRLAAVTGFQATTQRWIRVAAKLFCDASGDSILAPLTGATTRRGREAAGEFGEDIMPAQADHKTMGLSCLIQAREMLTPQPFTPPHWANVYASEADLPHRVHRLNATNFWWIELGGEDDSIGDTEKLRDELLKAAFGVWDHIKNRCEDSAKVKNWALDWVGFVPGKRESRRYVGDHILNQNDVRAGGRFEDIVAYGGWTMDDHHPAGLRYSGHPTTFHPAPSPYGIPYRALYSADVANLFCAGRNISVTHAALSSTRVMATCAIIGQAVGTAAAIAARENLTARAVGRERLRELQTTLMEDDCWLPGLRREIPGLTREAALTAVGSASAVGSAGSSDLNGGGGVLESLRGGVDRPREKEANWWAISLGEQAGEGGQKSAIGAASGVEYRFPAAREITQARLVFDSHLNRKPKNAVAVYPIEPPHQAMPAALVRTFRLEAEQAGAWRTVARVEENHQRVVRVPLGVSARAVRLVPEQTWGADEARVYGFDLR